MKIDFLTNKEEYKVLYDFLTKNITNQKIKSFSGELNNEGLPYGGCSIVLELDNEINSYTRINFNLSSSSKLTGVCLATKKNGEKVKFNFFDETYGEISYPDESIYVGKISKLKKEGRGAYTEKNGTLFAGNFANDKKHGEFKVTFLDGIDSIMHYNNDEAVGVLKKKVGENFVLTAKIKNNDIVKVEYTLFNPDLQSYIYYKAISKLKNPLFEVTGEFEVYIGDFLSYIGSIQNGVMHGYGTSFNENGSRYEGNFENGTIEGYGALFDENDNIIKMGIWENGVLVEPEIINNNSVESNTSTASLIYLNNSIKNIDVIKLKEAIKNIENFIVGQDIAINEISNNLLLSFLMEREDNKPITSILMTGPTGVGKTETAKQISKHLFNKEPYVIDFANFIGSHMIASLIGSPNGYVGYGDEPEFLTFLAENQEKGGVILFEEIDKCDEECLNFFMRMLDEGEVLSAKNESYKVNNFVILATTNMSANTTKKLGFNAKNDIKDSLANGGTSLKREQLARFNLVTEYVPLKKEAKIELCKRAVEDTIEKVKKISGYNIEIKYKKDIFEDIVTNSNATFGVRELKKQAKKVLTEKLAEFIRKNDSKNIKVIINSLEDIIIQVKKEKQLKPLKLPEAFFKKDLSSHFEKNSEDEFIKKD